LCNPRIHRPSAGGGPVTGPPSPSTGAGAAIVAASERPGLVKAVVSSFRVYVYGLAD